jgi:vacuolar-type H+-ATPase subunit D/Vma8
VATSGTPDPSGLTRSTAADLQATRESLLEAMQRVERRVVDELKARSAVGELGSIAQRLEVLGAQIGNLEGAISQIEMQLDEQQRDAQMALQKELAGLRHEVNAYLLVVTVAVLLLVLLAAVLILFKLG